MTAAKPEIQRALVKYRKELIALSDDVASKRLFKILQKIETRMLSAIRRNTGKVTVADVTRVKATINAIVLESFGDLAAWMNGGVRAAKLNGVKTQAEFLKRAFKVTRWQEIPVAKVRNTFELFARASQAGRLARFDRALFGKYAKEFSRYASGTIKHVEREFLQATITGDSWSNLAKKVGAQFKADEIPGRIDKDAFSRAYTRTMLTEAANQASVWSAKAAFGEDIEFVNLGVSDTRQSDICRGASAQPPMTEAAWIASEWGKPPRHVMNCRCDLVAVPAFLEDETITDEVLELSGEDLVAQRLGVARDLEEAKR